MAGIITLEDEWDRQPDYHVQGPGRFGAAGLWVPEPGGCFEAVHGQHALNQGGGSTSIEYGKCGLAVRGTGSDAYVGDTGYYTTAGAGNSERALANKPSMAVVAIVEFLSLASSNEMSIIRCDASGDNFYALDVYPSTKTVRPLLVTDGATGWTVGNDVVHNEIVVNVPLVFIMRYFAGSPIEVSVGPIGGNVNFTKTATNVSGLTKSSSGSYNTLKTHIGGLWYGTAYSFPGRIYGVGVFPRYITNGEARVIQNNPWSIFPSV